MTKSINKKCNKKKYQSIPTAYKFSFYIHQQELCLLGWRHDIEIGMKDIILKKNLKLEEDFLENLFILKLP